MTKVKFGSKKVRQNKPFFNAFGVGKYLSFVNAMLAVIAVLMFVVMVIIDTMAQDKMMNRTILYFFLSAFSFNFLVMTNIILLFVIPRLGICPNADCIYPTYSHTLKLTLSYLLIIAVLFLLYVAVSIATKPSSFSLRSSFEYVYYFMPLLVCTFIYAINTIIYFGLLNRYRIKSGLNHEA